MLVIISRLAFILIQMISNELRAAGLKLSSFAQAGIRPFPFFASKRTGKVSIYLFRLQYLHKGFQTMLQGVLLYKDHHLI